MPCTTFLHDGELNQPTSNEMINELLQHARQETCADWQIIERTVTPRVPFWRKAKEVKVYEVYKYVGGMGPWQCINFCVPSSEENSLAGSLGVESFVIINYMYGILAGAQAVERKHVSEKAN